MKLVADENLGRSVIQKRREAGHEVIPVAEMEPRISDEALLSAANSHEAMLVTEDKDFGELVFRRPLVHQGVILLRLAGLPVPAKAYKKLPAACMIKPPRKYSRAFLSMLDLTFSPSSIRNHIEPLPTPGFLRQGSGGVEKGVP